MYRASKDKPLSKKEERTNRRIREKLIINEKDTIYKGVIDNNSNAHINITQRLIEMGIVPVDINVIARKVVTRTVVCIMEVSHPDTNRYCALLMYIGREIKKLYKQYKKQDPNLVSIKGHYKNTYNKAFYTHYADNLLYSYVPMFEEFDYEDMRNFYYSRRNKVGWYDYRLFKKK